ncbi:MAG: uroporphyrinogen-III synthase, partial [Chthoniobacterales bacterium]|nr:uroporphyrinogen-III synthase [Chthoniobacterales bacterium]
SVLTIFTGHEDPEKTDSKVDYSALARLPGTKVMLMGAERLRMVTELLLKEGMAPDTPAAFIHWASTAKQQTVVSNLANLASEVSKRGIGSPAVVVFGEVVRLREKLAWFEKRPLFGKRIAVTRTRHQASTLLKALRELGADAFEMPMIKIAPPKRPAQFRELVSDSHRYDWIVFTSPNGVEAFFQQFFEIYSDARCLGPAKIAAIGPATAAKIREYHFAVDLMPEKFVAEEIVASFRQLGSVENQLFLLPRAEGARDVLPKLLTEMGAIVDEAIAYRTIPETEDPAGGVRRFREEGADFVTFTSSSTAESFHSIGLNLPKGCFSASIGPITSKSMRELGIRVDIEASRHDIIGLVEAITNASLATNLVPPQASP